MKILADNRQARFDYFLENFFECGVALEGWEVKAILAGKVSLNEAYVRVVNDEVFLIGCNVSPIGNSNAFTNLDATRSRKLLLKRSEIDKLIGKTKVSGFTLIPVKLYYKNRLIKMEIALAKGKKQYDKREDKKQQDADREIRRTVKLQRF